MRKTIYISLGLISLGVGAAAAALPLLPSFPFLLLAAFSFARGSDRLHSWYLGTRLYKDNIGPFVKGRGMTWATKIKTMVIVTLSMSIGYIMMHKIPVGRIILAVIWVLHIVYFIFGVKTIGAKGAQTVFGGEEA
ncbi:MAG: DUF454 domain-containing protein [Bacteroidales bacterium]|nr:DUF454 domain-containing protein [Bacteroidales bacterium]